MTPRRKLVYNPPMDDSNINATTPLSTSDLRRKTAEAREGFTVLVVDDFPDNRALISLELQQNGYRVVTASNGEEAVTLAATTVPDIILMDIGLPQMDGLAATRKIRENPPLEKIPVIGVTAFVTEGFRRAAYDAGFDGYLTKPIDFDKLNELIRKLLNAK